MKEKEKDARGEFRTRLGFIIACVGSAVGMGNIWMFPYRTGEFGGSAFLIAYFIFVILLGFSGVIGEMAFGRSVKCGPIGAFTKLAVDFGSIGWHFLGLLLTFAIMLMGVSKGIEKMNKVMMPIFFIFFILLLIRVVMLPGAAEGYRYMFVPRWEELGNIQTWVYALGQAFFSLSLAGSGTIVYGSYLKKDIDVVSCAGNVALFDTCAALLAGMVVIPAVFAFGLDVGSGPPLMFITLPAVFQQIPFGALFAVIFFIAVIFAAVTSLMNLFETPIEAL